MWYETTSEKILIAVFVVKKQKITKKKNLFAHINCNICRLLVLGGARKKQSVFWCLLTFVCLCVCVSVLGCVHTECDKFTFKVNK